MRNTTALLLAAGGGRRLGNRPKALLPFRGRPLVEHAVSVLRAGGCARVLVVLGAAAQEVLARADLTGCEVVLNEDWETGMGSSLRAGLAALPPESDAALVSLVDTPGVTPEAVRRVLAQEAELAAAAYAGERGHPVLIARRHWPEAAAGAQGDAGARALLRAHADELRLVEVGDVAENADIDTEADWRALQGR
ncbi:nucleotidyltransferase family protein [Streptacidiphilus monticola]|uniref:NTP transferase domain-containing protein n=1 Tax=Streptacidiphilus monticola TaxID=2161674 RepID=A0ABW1G4U5_9ACTN